MPGQSRVPGGDEWVWARGNGVCCQIAAASGGAGGSGSPGLAQRGTRNEPGPPSRGVAVSTTKVPASTAPGGSGAFPSSLSAPAGAPWRVPTWTGAYGNTVMPGSGVTEPTSSGGTGPPNTTHRAPVAARSQAYGESIAGATAGRPPPGNVPAPRSLAPART